MADYIYVDYASSSPFLIQNYTYYPSGLRKTKTTALAISNYIWDGSDMICEYASSATSGKVYIYGHTLISQGNVSIGFHNKSRRTFILRLFVAAQSCAMLLFLSKTPVE